MVVYVVNLTDNGTFPPTQGGIYRIPKGSTVKFVIEKGAKASANAKLYTNYPVDKHEQFHRHSFTEVPKSQSNNDDVDWTRYVEMRLPGPFEFYVEYLNRKDGSTVRAQSGHILVDPALKINGVPLPIEGLNILTVLTKCIGRLNAWRQSLAVAKLANYNMIHFTPVQQLGASRSAYSIKDQLTLSQSLFVREDEGQTTQFFLKEDQKRHLLEDFVRQLEEEFKCLAMTDVVWNHTSFDSEWLSQHPDGAYTPQNSPHLRIAFELDEALHKFSCDVEAGKYKDEVKEVIASEDDLKNVIRFLKDRVLVDLKLWEYYVIDVKGSVDDFRSYARQNASKRKRGERPVTTPMYTPEELASMTWARKVELLKRDALFRKGEDIGEHNDFGSTRYPYKINLDVALQLFSSTLQTTHTTSKDLFQYIPQTYSQYNTFHQFVTMKPENTVADEVPISEKALDDACNELQRALDEINLPFYAQYDKDIEEILRNITGTVRYERLSPHGPQLGAITRDSPLVKRYFTVRHVKRENSDTEEILAFANNGWVMGASQTFDFISPYSKAYYLRQVVIWGDCVKLRYGKKPEDSPWLWEHMKQYTMHMAKVFHGFRIDNAHSTPPQVGEYLLDAARSVRPDLFVCAELFAGTEEKDKEFVNRWGINALIREAMNAGNTTEMARYMYRYGGGRPVGRPKPRLVPHPRDPKYGEVLLTAALPPALLYDCTHDNPVPAQKRTAVDTLPHAALVCMCCCAIGSARGFDEIFPEQVDLVKVKADYNFQASMSTGIIMAKHFFNNLHTQMASEGFSEIHVDQRNDNVIAVTRHNPRTHESYLTVCSSAYTHFDYTPDTSMPRVSSSDNLAPFSPRKNASISSPFTLPTKFSTYSERNFTVRVPGRVDKVVFAAQLVIPDSNSEANIAKFKKGKVLKGMESHMLSYKADTIHRVCTVSKRTDKTTGETYSEINFQDFVPGTVITFHVSHSEEVQTAISYLRPFVADHEILEATDEKAVSPLLGQLKEIMSKLNLVDMNYLMFRCEAEERETNRARGAYSIPNYGPLAYCGIKGIIYVLDKIREKNDMGHPLYQNLREGNWLMDYTCERLNDWKPLIPLKSWLENVFIRVSKLPRFLIPKYFDAVMMTVEKCAEERCFQLMSPFVRGGDWFVKSLALTSVALFGVVSNAKLCFAKSGPEYEASLAAGLPHFATGYMRNWGRDTFISLRGLMIVTGRYQDARNLILSYAACARHGLIPNLLDGSNKPRFNARDAVWWFLQGLQDYVTMSHEGTKIFDAMVERWFPSDDQNAPRRTLVQPLSEIVQELMEKHANGIHFREWNAGLPIDDRMQDQGFNVDIECDVDGTGFVSGGNKFNCGTWMDKMGESAPAGNRGIPATPRDGADIEIIGLLKSTLRWLSELSDRKLFPYSGVNLHNHPSKFLSYKEWNNKVQQAFETHFYVPVDPNEDYKYRIDKANVHRRGIYKDIVGCSTPFADYQLRPNMCVAMAVAPELFNPTHAETALNAVQDVLLGPLGMKTLDPKDWAYRGTYNNAEDSSDFSTAKGFNYHQGPEWLWCTGYFLRAKLNFHRKEDPEATRHAIMNILSAHKEHLKNSPYLALPELTNENGKHCPFSCEAQAWSMATLLDALHDMSYSGQQQKQQQQ